MELVPQAPTPPHAGAFADDFGVAVQALRQALDRLLRSLDADPSRPQDLSRRFGLNKNLTWKLSRLIASSDPAAALRFVPGNSGLKIVRETLGGMAAAERDAELATAIERFDAMVTRHAGDRSSLEMLVQGLAHERLEPETLEAARRLAFQGNSAIWGVQARVQLSATVLYPSATKPGWVDTLDIGGLLDFRRIRPEVRWQLFGRQSYDLEEGTSRPSESYPIVPPPGGPEGAPLLPSFCSTPLPHVEVEPSPDQIRYVLPGGPIGNTAQLTCMYATSTREIGPATVDADDGWSEIGTNLITPVEQLQLDVLVHEDLELPPFPEVRLLGRMDGHSPFAEHERAGRTLPFGERVVDLGRGLTGLASAQVPGCTEIVAYALEQIGWSSDKLRGWRFAMPFPPIPAIAAIALPLPRAK